MFVVVFAFSEMYAVFSNLPFKMASGVMPVSKIYYCFILFNHFRMFNFCGSTGIYLISRLVVGLFCCWILVSNFFLIFFFFLENTRPLEKLEG